MDKMAVGINLATASVDERITKLLNDSGLPYVNKRYILEKKLEDVKRLEVEAIQKEAEEYKKVLDENTKEGLV